MMNTVQKTVSTGNGFKTRLHIRRFKHSGDMHKFLNEQFDNKWAISSHDFKSGIYALAGGQYHNVKHLDPTVLAHV